MNTRGDRSRRESLGAGDAGTASPSPTKRATRSTPATPETSTQKSKQITTRTSTASPKVATRVSRSNVELTITEKGDKSKKPEKSVSDGDVTKTSDVKRTNRVSESKQDNAEDKAPVTPKRSTRASGEVPTEVHTPTVIAPKVATRSTPKSKVPTTSAPDTDVKDSLKDPVAKVADNISSESAPTIENEGSVVSKETSLSSPQTTVAPSVGSLQATMVPPVGSLQATVVPPVGSPKVTMTAPSMVSPKAGTSTLVMPPTPELKTAKERAAWAKYKDQFKELCDKMQDEGVEVVVFSKHGEEVDTCATEGGLDILKEMPQFGVSTRSKQRQTPKHVSGTNNDNAVEVTMTPGSSAAPKTKGTPSSDPDDVEEIPLPSSAEATDISEVVFLSESVTPASEGSRRGRGRPRKTPASDNSTITPRKQAQKVKVEPEDDEFDPLSPKMKIKKEKLTCMYCEKEFILDCLLERHLRACNKAPQQVFMSPKDRSALRREKEEKDREEKLKKSAQKTAAKGAPKSPLKAAPKDAPKAATITHFIVTPAAELVEDVEQHVANGNKESVASRETEGKQIFTEIIEGEKVVTEVMDVTDVIEDENIEEDDTAKDDDYNVEADENDEEEEDADENIDETPRKRKRKHDLDDDWEPGSAKKANTGEASKSATKPSGSLTAKLPNILKQTPNQELTTASIIQAVNQILESEEGKGASEIIIQTTNSSGETSEIVVQTTESGGTTIATITAQDGTLADEGSQTVAVGEDGGEGAANEVKLKEVKVVEVHQIGTQKTIPDDAQLQTIMDSIPIDETVCAVCKKEFKENKYLVRHMVVHSNKKKRFGCLKCPKRFTRKYDLHVHMIRVHGWVKSGRGKVQDEVDLEEGEIVLDISAIRNKGKVNKKSTEIFEAEEEEGEITKNDSENTVYEKKEEQLEAVTQSVKPTNAQTTVEHSTSTLDDQEGTLDQEQAQTATEDDDDQQAEPMVIDESAMEGVIESQEVEGSNEEVMRSTEEDKEEGEINTDDKQVNDGEPKVVDIKITEDGQVQIVENAEIVQEQDVENAEIVQEQDVENADDGEIQAIDNAEIVQEQAVGNAEDGEVEGVENGEIQEEKEVVADEIDDMTDKELEEELEGLKEGDMDITVDNEAEDIYQCLAAHPGKCEQCDKELTDMKQVVYHFETCHGDKPLFQCSFCPLVYNSFHNLRRHYLFYHVEKKYACTQCPKKFRLPRLLAMHTKIHDDNPSFLCDFCGKKFSHQVYLNKHKMRHDDYENLAEDKKYSCRICKLYFNWLPEYQSHMKNHQDDEMRIYQCEKCPKRFFKVAHLKRHLVTHTEERPFTCTVEGCDRRYKDTDTLRKHLKFFHTVKPVISEEDREKFPCQQCGKTFYNANHLKRHKFRHSGVRPFPCEHCGKAFAEKKSLENHVRIHTGERPYACKECDRRFIQISHLNRHMYLHTQIRNFECPECKKRFFEKADVEKHMRVHSKVRPFKCDLCDLSFSQRNILICHRRRHTGEKPYICDICSRSFTQLGSLQTHRRLHTGERPYKCQFCNLGFVSKERMKFHSFIHTGITPHICHICGKGFRLKFKLQSHLDSHEGVYRYKCTMCDKGFLERAKLNRHLKQVHNEDYPESRMTIIPARSSKLENAAGELIDEAEIEGDNSMQQEIIIQNIGSYEMKEATEGEVIEATYVVEGEEHQGEGGIPHIRLAGSNAEATAANLAALYSDGTTNNIQIPEDSIIYTEGGELGGDEVVYVVIPEDNQTVILS